MSHENVEVVRRAMTAWNSGDLDDGDLVEELFAPDFEWVPAPNSLLSSGAYRGYEGLRRFRTDLFSAWDEYALDRIEELLDAGDQVVVIVRIRARTREIEVDEVWSGLLTVRDGRIVRFQGFTSREGAFEAAGLSE